MLEDDVGCGAGGAVFVAALMTDLRLKILLNPPPVLAPGVLDRLAGSWLLLFPFPLNKPSIAPPIIAAAPMRDDPIKPAAAVDGLSKRSMQQCFNATSEG